MLGSRRAVVHELDAFNEAHRAAQQAVRGQIWDFYRDLIAYKSDPSVGSKAELDTRFDAIFQQRTGFATLDKLLKRLLANKAELLVVLDRPEIPLHNNGTENVVRDYVTKRKVSGGTRSDRGRDCRRVSQPAQNLQKTRHRILGLSRSETENP